MSGTLAVLSFLESGLLPSDTGENHIGSWTQGKSVCTPRQVKVLCATPVVLTKSIMVQTQIYIILDATGESDMAVAPVIWRCHC